MRLDEPPYFYQCKRCKRRFTVKRKKHTITQKFQIPNTPNYGKQFDIACAQRMHQE